MRLSVVILPEFRWPAAREIWRRAEALGFDHAWTYDHLTWRSFRDSAWFGAVPTLTAAAGVTARIRLGTLVASPNLRHPVTFAKELISLDDISGGRFTLGLGAGGHGYDATTLRRQPWPVRERTARFAEFVELTDRLLREPVTTYEGSYYSAYDARMYPGCVQRPRIPFAVAGSGPRGMRLAVQHGQIWVTTGERGGTDPEPLSADQATAVLSRQLTAVDAACAAAGRDPATLRRLVVTGLTIDPGLDSPAHFTDTVGRFAELGFTDLVVHWPGPEPPFAADEKVFERATAAAVSGPG